jgi:hypothetical protein
MIFRNLPISKRRNLKMKKNKSTTPREFRKLLKLHTDESHKAYLKAQKQYLSVLTKFVKKEVARDNNFEDLFGSSFEYCMENQNEMYWAWIEDKNNEIKVLNNVIWSYEYELLNPEEFEEELN